MYDDVRADHPEHHCPAFAPYLKSALLAREYCSVDRPELYWINVKPQQWGLHRQGNKQGGNGDRAKLAWRVKVKENANSLSESRSAPLSESDSRGMKSPWTQKMLQDEEKRRAKQVEAQSRVTSGNNADTSVWLQFTR
jgi:hypothetical protein